PQLAGLNDARALLAGARSVRFVALGSSRHAAGYGARAMQRLASLPAFVDVAPTATEPPAPTTPDDVVIAVSQSGATPAILQAVRGVHAPVIAIVNNAYSELSRLATVTIDCGAGPERVIAATKSTTATMAALRALVAPVSPAVAQSLVRALTDILAAPF